MGDLACAFVSILQVNEKDIKPQMASRSKLERWNLRHSICLRPFFERCIHSGLKACYSSYRQTDPDKR